MDAGESVKRLVLGPAYQPCSRQSVAGFTGGEEVPKAGAGGGISAFPALAASDIGWP